MVPSIKICKCKQCMGAKRKLATSTRKWVKRYYNKLRRKGKIGKVYNCMYA